MSIKDLIASAYNKDAASFESHFAAAMQEKVAAALRSRFGIQEEVELEEAKDEDEEDDSNGDSTSDEDSASDDEDMKKEEVEELDELSKKTLSSYYNKANDESSKKVNDRWLGRTRAVSKIAGYPSVKVPATEK